MARMQMLGHLRGSSGGTTRDWRTDNKPSGDMSYMDTIADLASKLAPGGDIEQGRIAEINKEAELLANKMEGVNIARGLGNATLGVGATVGRLAAGQREQVRSNLLGQYLSTLQFLVNANLQQQEVDTQVAGKSIKSGGLDVFGKPMSGTLAEAEMNLATSDMQRAANPEGVPPNRQQYPSIYGGGGAGLELDFGNDPFMTVPEEPEPYDSATMFGTPMMGTSERWLKDTAGGTRGL